MMQRVYKDQSGLTIIEVLVSAVVFMVGFTVLVALLSQTLSRFSTRELLAASTLADELMGRAVLDGAAVSGDTTIERSSMHFRVERESGTVDSLATYRFRISRVKSERILVDLYSETRAADK